MKIYLRVFDKVFLESHFYASKILKRAIILFHNFEHRITNAPSKIYRKRQYVFNFSSSSSFFAFLITVNSKFSNIFCGSLPPQLKIWVNAQKMSVTFRIEVIIWSKEEDNTHNTAGQR